MGLVARRPEDEEGEEQSDVVITGFGDLDGDGPVPVGLDLTTWGEAGRTALDERFHLLEAPHGWNGPILVVAEADVPWISRIIEQVEDERSLALDPDTDQIAYDLTGWDEQNLSLLVHGLQDRAVAFALVDEELVVHEADEQQVDDLVDTILEPDGPEVGEEARPELLGDLFLTVDRLVHHPRDKDAQEELVTGAAEVAASAPPYGVERPWWKGIGEQCAALAAQLDPVTLDDDEVIASATALRDALRPYV